MPVITAIPGSTFALDADALRYGYLPMRVRGMPSGGINSAHRSLAEQETLFFARHTRTHPNSNWDGPFDDVRWYLGERYVRTSSAGPVSVPGTSTHNAGRALDMATNSEAHAWMVRNALAYGWKRTLWDAYKVEPWHWEWDKSRVTINDQEDDMTPEQEAKIDGLITIARRVEDRVAGNIDGPIVQAASDSKRAALRLGGSVSSATLTDEIRARATTATVKAQHDAVMARIDALGAPHVDTAALSASVAAILMGELQALGQSIPEATVAELVATLTAGIRG